ncbi:MAG: phosphate ABC transporter permease PstA [Candidatus Thermoplasmatota archaeon]
MNKRLAEEWLFKILMITSLCFVLGSLLIIIGLVLYHGAPAITIEMVTQTSSMSLYTGRGGGILNAIIGSILLAIPATILAFIVGIFIALYLQRDFTDPRLTNIIRFVLDILWGTPSIIYGVFCMMIMFALGATTSLLWGIIALTLLEIPIITRYMDESINMVPHGLKESAYSLGSTRVETAFKIVRKQALPGILAGVLLGLGRGIGDAASIVFLIGDSNSIPTSLNSPTSALPTMIFNLYSQPDPYVRQKAYAAAFILLMIVLLISVTSRVITKRITKHVIR